MGRQPTIIASWWFDWYLSFVGWLNAWQAYFWDGFYPPTIKNPSVQLVASPTPNGEPPRICSVSAPEEAGSTRKRSWKQPTVASPGGRRQGETRRGNDDDLLNLWLSWPGNMAGGLKKFLNFHLEWFARLTIIAFNPGQLEASRQIKWSTSKTTPPCYRKGVWDREWLRLLRKRCVSESVMTMTWCEREADRERGSDRQSGGARERESK